jgi:dTDP-4-amino-4,6-dideoxygalactose transaminase
MRYVLSRRDVVQGPLIRVYEAQFAKEVGVRFAYSFASGRIALYALLKSFGLAEGDEVLLQAPTHIVVPNAIRYAGGTPVYVDCRLDDFNMDMRLVTAKIGPKTRFLLVQHTFGIPIDMDAARSIAQQHSLVLIEDCVHALGTIYKNEKAGSMGQAAFFSTEETKIISSTMGGMAVTDDPEIAAKLKEIQAQCTPPDPATVRRYLVKFIIYYLFTHPYLHPYTRPIYMTLRRYPAAHLAPGATSKQEMSGTRPDSYLQQFSNGQALIAMRQLSRLADNLQHRRQTAKAYHQQFSDDGHRVIQLEPSLVPSFVRYPLLVSDREAAMRACGGSVILGQWFNSVLEESTSPAHGGYKAGSCPNAEFASRHLVNVPTHGRVSPSDVRRITHDLKNFVLEPA